MARKTNKQKAQKLIDEVEHLYDEAKTPHEKKTWAETALPTIDEAIELDPNNADAWSDRGIARVRLGYHDSALDDSTRAIELKPKDATLWSNRGLVKSESGDHQSALEDYNKAIELDPKNAAAWSNRGASKNDLGDHGGAIEDYNKAIELKPKDSTIWNNRGAAKNALGDYSDALDDYNEAIKRDPENAAAWSNRGAEKYRLGKYDDARKDFDEALRLDPKNEDIQRNRQAANVAEKQNEYRDQLEERAEKFNKNFKRNIWKRRWLFYIVVILIAGHIYWLWCMGVFSDISSNPFGVLPFLALLFTILSPFIWLIRINIREAERNLTLREDYYSRYIVELYLDRFFTEERDRQEFAQKYMAYWMYNNPSETLIRLANKSAEKSELPQVEYMNNIVKNVQPPPTDQ